MQTTDRELFKELVVQASSSTAAFCLLFFREHFDRPFCDMHKQIFGLIDDETCLRKLLLAPRGMGKTTLFSLGYTARKACFGLKRHVVIISNTLDQSLDQLETLKQEIETNELLEQAFGDLRGPIWREDRIQLANGCHIIARGAGQQIRGKKKGKDRPDLIVGDDLEDPEMVMSQERRAKFKKWFFSDLMRAGKDSGQSCEIAVVGTLLHEDALLAGLMRDPGWRLLHLEAFDDNLEPTWPDFMSKEQVRALYDEYERQGLLDVLYQEYRNIIASPENRAFRAFHRYGIGSQMFQMVERQLNERSIPSCVIVDPARTDNPMSDYSAIGGVAFDLVAGSIFYHRFKHMKELPEVVLRAAFEMAVQMRTPLIFVEEDGLNKWLVTAAKSLVMQFYQQTGVMLEIRPIKSGGRNKEMRIGKLAPLVNSGMAHFNEDETQPIMEQLKAFPRSKYDDASDMAAYALELLGETGGWSYQDDDFPVKEQADPLEKLTSWTPEEVCVI